MECWSAVPAPAAHLRTITRRGRESSAAATTTLPTPLPPPEPVWGAGAAGQQGRKGGEGHQRARLPRQVLRSCCWCAARAPHLRLAAGHSIQAAAHRQVAGRHKPAGGSPLVRGQLLGPRVLEQARALGQGPPPVQQRAGLRQRAPPASLQRGRRCQAWPALSESCGPAEACSAAPGSSPRRSGRSALRVGGGKRGKVQAVRGVAAPRRAPARRCRQLKSRGLKTRV